jgi:hypothetical protein
LEVFLESDPLNKWLTIGANIGVLIGLALLIFEIKQNNVLMLAQIEQSRSMSLVEWRRQLVLEDVGVNEIYARFDDVTDSDSERQLFQQLTPAERSRLISQLIADIYDVENVFAQYERGLISEEYWQERMVVVIRSRAFRWKEYTTLLDGPGAGTRQAFQDEVERILQTSGEAENP